MGLCDASSSSAYVLKSDLTMSTSSYADKFLAEDASYPSSPPNLTLLHEMIQISCCPFKSSPPYDHKTQKIVESVQTETLIDDHRDIDESMLEKSREACRRIDLMITEDDETERSWRNKSKEVAEKKTIKERESERLDELLEKCNLVQNSIAEKLCIYF